MKYLLDVNVLLAWGWSDHTEHDRAAAWIADMTRKRGVKLLTSAIPELGFVRVSVQRTGGKLPLAEAVKTLEGMLASLGPSHAFLPDDLPTTRGFPPWCTAASRTTDAHLLALASAHSAQLATLDTGIPGAFLIPT